MRRSCSGTSVYNHPHRRRHCTVDLAPGPPGDGSGELAEPPPPPPPPPLPSRRILARANRRGRSDDAEPKPDDIPEPDAEVKDEKKGRPRINVPIRVTGLLPQQDVRRRSRARIVSTGTRPPPAPGRSAANQAVAVAVAVAAPAKAMAGNTASSARSPNTHTRLERCAKRARLFFRALIGTDGKIQNIVISQSSGHTLLDPVCNSHSSQVRDRTEKELLAFPLPLR